MILLSFRSNNVDFERVSDCFQLLKETRSARFVALHAFIRVKTHTAPKHNVLEIVTLL